MMRILSRISGVSAGTSFVGAQVDVLFNARLWPVLMMLFVVFTGLMGISARFVKA